MDEDGGFGSVWLGISADRKTIYRLTEQSREKEPGTLECFPLSEFCEPYVDNYLTSNRLLCYRRRSPVREANPDDPSTSRVPLCHNEGDETFILGSSTNTCKQRLFAFVHIWECYAEGTDVTEEDPIFEQFNAKCPKCGRVYEDQHRRICKYCVNHKSTFIRLLGYFKPFKLQLITVLICLIFSSGIALINPIIGGQLLYDQVVDSSVINTTDGNGNRVLSNVAKDYPEEFALTQSSNPFLQLGDIFHVLFNKRYYYYKPEVGGKYVRTDEVTYVEAPEGDTSSERYALYVTSDKSEYDGASLITGRLHKESLIIVVMVGLFAIAMFSLFISIVQNRSNAYMSTRVTRTMKTDIFNAMQRLSISFFNQNPTGRLINRVNYDAVKVRNFYIDGVPYFIVNLLNFIGLTFFLFSINWQLTLIVFIPVPAIVAIIKIMIPKLWRCFSKQWHRSSSLNSMLNDSLSGVRVVKAFAKEAEESHRFYDKSQKLYAANLKANLVALTIFPVISLLIGMSSQAIWGFGGIKVMGGAMTYGQLTTYLSYVGMIFAPLSFFTNFTNLLTDTMNSADRIFETMDTIPEITDAKNAVHLDEIKGHIVFDKVCFHYSPNRPILKNISYEIKPGDNVGLVGHTGSGKSTIANLITRMYDVVSGSISIDGHNIKDIEISSLRKNIAIVSQEIFLFYGTIADNIRYARPDATMDEVITAAKNANAHDFIMRLPEGYETMVGIGSRSLSGGERQRISIARALLLSPSLLILDEATAAMDTETERLIGDAIDRLIVGRTTISIAHRLSTLKNCNLLMAIENGEIAEIGSAEELMEKKGVYYKLYTLQNEQMQKVVAGV